MTRRAPPHPWSHARQRTAARQPRRNRYSDAAARGRVVQARCVAQQLRRVADLLVGGPLSFSVSIRQCSRTSRYFRHRSRPASVAKKNTSLPFFSLFT